MKVFKRIIIIFLLMLLIVYSYCNASNANLSKESIINTSTSSFVSLSEETINIKKEFYLILNLSNISYNKFRVDITNNDKLLSEDVTEKVTNLSVNDVATSFIVDKSLITLEKLGVVYTSPQNETKIKFSVKITNMDETKEEIESKITNVELNISDLKNTLKDLNEILSGIEDTESDLYISTQGLIKEATDAIEEKEQEKANLDEKLENFSESMSSEIIINVIDKKIEEEEVLKEESQKDAWGEKDSMLSKDKEKEMNASMKKMMEQMSGLEKDLKNANDRITTLTSGETYKGSQNNYLKSLTIKDVEFKNNFKKTTMDYFARLDDDDLDNVTINAVAEDSSAIVTIYGNTNLKDGKNKIIINVTADNGNVRTYRIYLTK